MSRLKKISGWTDYRLNPKPVALAPGEVSKPKRKLIWPGFITQESGRTIARYSPKKSSAAITALLGTDGLIFQDAADSSPADLNVGTILWDDILKP